MGQLGLEAAVSGGSGVKMGSVGFDWRQVWLDFDMIQAWWGSDRTQEW